MHSFYTRRVAPLAVAALLLFGAAQAQAHALYADHTWQGTVALVQFAYAGGAVPTYAKVEVYSPADAKVEFQNGRTDAQGRFAFMPDTPGPWRIIMADNMGHRVEHAVDASAGQRAAQISAQNQGKPSAAVTSPGVGGFALPLRVLLGLSLLANMALGVAALRRKQKQS